jgi:type IV secretory pathway VirB2 component (pilin)
MKKYPFLAFLVFLAAAASSPAHAAGGGSTLAFNDTLTTIQQNLTGPTANTIVVILFVGGLIGIGVSKDSAWMKTMGGIAVIAALIAKAPTVIDQLGIGGASAASHYPWQAIGAVLQIGLALFALSLLRIALRRSPRPAIH